MSARRAWLLWTASFLSFPIAGVAGIAVARAPLGIGVSA
jgi:hypothetical protein